jgi:hypothetical protein
MVGRYRCQPHQDRHRPPDMIIVIAKGTLASGHHRIQGLPLIRIQASTVGRGHAPAARAHETTGYRISP